MPGLGETYGLAAMLLSGPLHSSPEKPGWCVLTDDAANLKPRTSQTNPFNWPEDVYSLVFSSGTSGVQKCLKMGRIGAENTVDQSSTAWKVVREDNILLTMPFSNFQQRWIAYMAITHGFNISLVPPELMFRAMKQMSPTIILGPPAFFEILEKRFAAKSLSYRTFATIIDVPIRWFLPQFVTAIKTTPVSGISRHLWRQGPPSLCRLGAKPTRNAAAVQDRRPPAFPGLWRDGIRLDLIQSTREKPDGFRGRPASWMFTSKQHPMEEIIVSGGNAVQSYGYAFGSEQFQKDVFLSATHVATGDIGHLDRKGYLFLTGRKKNVIITNGGLKLSPESIESQVEALGLVSRAVSMRTKIAPG